jgi:GMP synthase (glutamine-hydrolysing)
MALRLLVVEGNVRAARDRHASIFGKTPSRSYADVLASLAGDAACDLCFPADEGAALPEAAGLADYDGVAVTGSALNIYDDGPEVRRQLALLRAVFAAGTPCFGSCWGLQVACAAAGGTVIRNPRGREIGLARNIAPTPAGRAHPLLEGRPAAFDAPCSHYDVVAIPPPEAQPLASNRLTPFQAAEFRSGDAVFWGVQYHPEYTLTELAAVLQRSIPSLIEQGKFQSQEQGERYCEDLRALDADASRSDLAWRLGIGPEVLDPAERLTELRNWLAHRVRPERSRRGRA